MIENLLIDVGQISNDINTDEIKSLVSKLYVAMNIDESEKNKEESILKKIDTLKIELEPLDKVISFY